MAGGADAGASVLPMTDKPITDAMVVFSPSGKRGRFPLGTPVLQAARSLGVDLDSVCGGRAICGRCQVVVTEGKLAKHAIESRAENLSPAGEAEARFDQAKGLKTGYRLSCQATIQGDIAIDVPAGSQLHRQVVRKPYEAHDIKLDPVVHPYYVEVRQADLRDPSGDLERLQAALLEQWGIEAQHCDLRVTQALQKVLREGDWKVTIAIHNDNEIIGVWPGFKDDFYGVAIDIGTTTIYNKMTMGYHQTSFRSAGSKSHAVNNIIKTRFKDLKQIQTCQPASLKSNFIIAAELTLKHAIDSTSALLGT